MSFKTEVATFLAANPSPTAQQLEEFIVDTITEDSLSRPQLDRLAAAMATEVDEPGETSPVDKALRLMGRAKTT